MPEKAGDDIKKAKDIEAIHNEALDIKSQNELTSDPPETAPDAPDLQEAWKKADEARQIYEQAANGLSEKEKALNDKEKEIAESLEEIQQKESAFSGTEKALQHKENELNSFKNRLLEQEEELKKREYDANAGFIQQRKASLETLDIEAKSLNDELSSVRKQIAEERSKWRDEKRAEEEKLHSDFKNREQALATTFKKKEANLLAQIKAEQERLDKVQRENEEEIKRKEKKLKIERLNIEAEQEIFEEDKQSFESKVKQKAAADIEHLEFENRSILERLEAARKDRDVLLKKLEKREEADRCFGHKTPDEVFDEMKILEKEIDRLRRELENRPGEDAVKRLKTLENEQEEWHRQKMQIESEKSGLKKQLGLCQIGVIELENLRDQKAALETSRNVLQATLKELRADVEERIKSAQGECPFPACKNMDEKDDLQTPFLPVSDDIGSLKKFTEDLQQRIAYDPATEKTLYYSLPDIRCFLGGLAMSRLHLLHGISGTGKTSLPLAFARAVGAGHTLVEVQAGWRDRHDLLGHFNVFEKRYYESEFLQALYEAQCPKYKNTLYVVVMDEMNLSYPEQYFADMLSALERDGHDQQLKLMTAPVDSAPRLMEDGRILNIPPNVWFVGTANQDETTKDFADKTYSRSHVMELSRHKDKFPINKKMPPRESVFYINLLNLFQKAQDRFADKARKAYEYLENNLADTFDRRFQVGGWGNRLESQMEKYVPVIIEAGGSIGEATDHVLATKILRKIRDRYDNNQDHLRELKENIEESWESLDKKNKPEKSLAILKNELIRLGDDG